ncbi:hypothetical protein ACRBEV_25660 [Methylobacterium phyllosphaerae]
MKKPTSPEATKAPKSKSSIKGPAAPVAKMSAPKAPMPKFADLFAGSSKKPSKKK